MDVFGSRHIGVSDAEAEVMLKKIGVSSPEELIAKIIPSDIRLDQFEAVGSPMSEMHYLEHMRVLAGKNRLLKSFIGLGYYQTFTPPVIHRNIFCNPGWYTAYTPYQAEIAQGRLEALLNFQTMVSDLTGLPVANASLLDEATAAAEAVFMMLSNRTREQQKKEIKKLFLSRHLFPQVKAVVYTRCEPWGVEVVEDDEQNWTPDPSFFGAIVQYPDARGKVTDFRELAAKCKSSGIQLAAGTDLLALCLLSPPGEWGADIAYGNSQRFGVPLGFGGPHAAFFAAREEYKRIMPGRIIGVSVDSRGKTAFRMALQTREQHIKREKATSNICTAQALLAIMAGMYAVWHGPRGLRRIAKRVHHLTVSLKKILLNRHVEVQDHGMYFDTILINCPDADAIIEKAEQKGYNLRKVDSRTLGISLDETTTWSDIEALGSIFGNAETARPVGQENIITGTSFERKQEYLTHQVFNSYHSETEMMRYIKRLENKDLSLVHSMISLGSCTMKLNAAAELEPLSWPEWSQIHPYVPRHQVQGYMELIENLNLYLSRITGFRRMSFQPNSGASGEYAGLMAIRAYHHHRGEKQRNLALIPSSAHGTNPASAAMAGMEIVVVRCDEKGNIDIQDLKTKAEQYRDRLSCLMITYPSTHGVYEEGIREITSIIHENGGLVYMDGANMNAQVGLTSPGAIGADVCHLNLHKTFAIPHGGGGPGMGPIGVNEKLEPFLPGHPFDSSSSSSSVVISASPFGSALILLISYGYIRMLGDEGLKKSTFYAMLNANYLKALLEPYYKILYTGRNGFCAHEFILDCSTFKQESGVEVADIAKRLMDYGFHAPTVAFPVVNTLMIEPTESESRRELERFAQALIQIRAEIQEIIEGKYPKDQNVLKNAPHTADMLIRKDYPYPYCPEKAAYPLPFVKENKFWPSCGRVDNAYGDRNLVCTCPPVSEYAGENSF